MCFHHKSKCSEGNVHRTSEEEQCQTQQTETSVVRDVKQGALLVVCFCVNNINIHVYMLYIHLKEWKQKKKKKKLLNIIKNIYMGVDCWCTQKKKNKLF